jgi:hypothetical protein
MEERLDRLEVMLYALMTVQLTGALHYELVDRHVLAAAREEIQPDILVKARKWWPRRTSKQAKEES